MKAPSKVQASMAAMFAACCIAAPVVIQNEGWKTTTYTDAVGISTTCGGVTGAGVVKGKTYTDAACESMTEQALLKHAIDINLCLPETMPAETRAAFISFGYNIGAPKFCASTASAKALHGDLPGACAELSKWVNAGGHPLPGLVTRRAQERALCEHGLSHAPAPPAAAAAPTPHAGFFHRLMTGMWS